MRIATAFLCTLSVLSGQSSNGEVPANFRTENLVAWCIVPFDAKQRGPAERTKMLRELGLKRCAYDWRASHVPTFEEEILEYKKHGVDYFAFWGEHEAAFSLFKKHGLTPQIWRTAPSPKGETQEAKVKAAADAMEPLAKRVGALGSKLGLYNHGGWGGEPKNLLAVCEELHARGHKHVGIVYNFHHAHEHIGDIPTWSIWFGRMMPHLLCVNLNGMADPKVVAQGKKKILSIGAGVHETALIGSTILSGYAGPIGVIGHRTDEDVAVTLRRNIEGLQNIVAKLVK